MTKTKLQKLVAEHLKLINYHTLDQAEAALTPEQWQSFWDVIVDRMISDLREEMAQEGASNNFPSETSWITAWDLVEKHYAKYVLEPTCKKFLASLP